MERSEEYREMFKHQKQKPLSWNMQELDEAYVSRLGWQLQQIQISMKCYIKDK